jgi:dolichol kinase
MTEPAGQISYSSELARKSIHLLSLLIPILYLQVNHVTGVTILLAMALASLTIDVLRHWHEPTRRLLMRLVGRLLRNHERENGTLRLTGATWVLIAATLSLGVFPPAVGVTAFSVLIVSDTFAALVGRRFGQRRFLDKSVEGTVTFIFTACCVVVVMGVSFGLPWTFWVAGCIGAVSAGIAEASAVRLGLDDNIAIPFGFAVPVMILDRVFRTLGEIGFADLIK